MPEIASSNIFIQPTLQFQVHESVPNVIQQVGASADQRDPSHIASVVAVENTGQATDTANTNQHDTSQVAGAAAVENMDQAMDTANTKQHDTSLNASVAAITNMDQATDALNTNHDIAPASTSTSMSAQVPQTGDPIPTPPHVSTSTVPDPTVPALPTTMFTPHVNSAVIRDINTKQR